MIKSNIEPAKRLLSLDIFRGFTIASMILVNNPGSWDHVFSQLKHAVWHGCTFTDLVFPFFIWIVGVAISLSFTNHMARGTNRRQILQNVFLRVILLFAIGLFLNGFPFGLTGSHTFSWSTIRIPGVLQRIAICYLITSIIFLYSKVAWQIICAIFLLAVSWLLIKTISVPNFGAGILEPAGNLAWYIDANLLHGHTYIKAPTLGFDSEGIFSTLTAIATTLSGVLTGHLLNSNKSSLTKTIWMLLAGVTGILLGLLMNNWLPINKNLWTSSYTVFASGMALTIFACFYWLADVKKYQKWFKVLEIYGLNALTIFVISILILRLTIFIQITESPGVFCSFKSYYYKMLFLPMGDTILTSLLHAIAFMLFMYLIAYILYRAKIIIKA